MDTNSLSIILQILASQKAALVPVASVHPPFINEWIPVAMQIATGFLALLAWMQAKEAKNKTSETHNIVNGQIENFKTGLLVAELAKGKLLGQQEEKAASAIKAAAQAAGVIEGKAATVIEEKGKTP